MTRSAREYRSRIYFAASVERVWRALTDREELAEWLLIADFRPLPGHRFRWKDAEGAEDAPVLPCPLEDAVCEVEAAEPPHRLKLLARPARRGADEDPSGAFRVTWTLEVAGEGTWLTLQQEFLPEALASAATGGRMLAFETFKRRRHPSFIHIRPLTLSERQAA